MGYWNDPLMGRLRDSPLVLYSLLLWTFSNNLAGSPSTYIGFAIGIPIGLVLRFIMCLWDTAQKMNTLPEDEEVIDLSDGQTLSLCSGAD